MKHLSETRPIALLATPPHPCSYLPDQSAVTHFIDPSVDTDARIYAELSALGFRRSGEHIYRPHCRGCQACIPVRLPVHRFNPRRCQRRTQRRNHDVILRWCPTRFDGEHFDLYQRYLAGRHRGGGMDNPSMSAFHDFLHADWATTGFLECRLNGALIAVGVVDVMEGALSAVYSFYDPQHVDRSLGRLLVLEEITLARRLGLDWLYLGYWVAACRKMRYKAEFGPAEYRIDGQWIEGPPAVPTQAD